MRSRLIATAVVLVVGVGVVLVIDRDRSDGVVESGVGDPPGATVSTASGGVTPVPGGPADGRTFPVSLWTGDELIVWGGEAQSEAIWTDDGAAFGPTSGTWRRLADSSLSARSEHTAVWTGDEMLVCCGHSPAGDARSTAGYDPTSDVWRPLAPPPFSASFAASAWTGQEMIVVGGSDFTGTAAYDPAEDAWRLLAPAPAVIERGADVAWTGEVLIVWPGLMTDSPGLVYDPVSDRWTELPPLPPESAIDGASMVWTGAEVIVWGTSRAENSAAVGARIGLEDAAWRPIADDPLPPFTWFEGTPGSNTAAWTGNEMVVWTGALGENETTGRTPVLAYDPADDRWRTIDQASTTGFDPPMVVAGDGVYVLTDPVQLLTP